MSIQHTDLRIVDPGDSIADWFQSVNTAGRMARASSTPGCQILDRNGAALWWNITQVFDVSITKLGYAKMSYPALIPRSLFEKEENHVEGFAPEFAMVKDLKGNPLADPLVLRPTSEVVIYEDFALMVQSKSDLPIKINQWCNVFRVEMRTRPLMRTMEFQWHEAHWAITEPEGARKHTFDALDQYTDFIQDVLAIPVIPGEKTEMERFAGADMTLTVEARMLDGKALQCGTSHMMGRGFAEAYNIGYTNSDGTLSHPITGSWGMSTRILGAIVMTHSDEKGLSLPPAIAPIQAVLMTVSTGNHTGEAFDNAVHNIKLSLEQSGVRFSVDDSDVRPGRKQYHWEKQGVPVRILYGKQEMANEYVTIVRRDTGEKTFISEADLPTALPTLLDQIQCEMFARAQARLLDNTVKVTNLSEFEDAIRSTSNAFIAAGWCGTREAEEQLKKDYGYTVRCIPFTPLSDFGTCFLTGQPAQAQVIVAKSY